MDKILQHFKNLCISEVADEKYVKDLSEIKKYTEKVWKTPIHTYFTDHGILHSERILFYCNKILDSMPSEYSLNVMERFILIGSAYLHDIGMQMPEEAGLEKKEYYTSEEKNTIREVHHFSSFYAIKKDFKNLIDTNSLIDEKIAIISKHHRLSGGNIDELEDTTLFGYPVRMKLLASLLRFCDELDADRQRILFSSVEFINLDPSTKYHWYAHKYINGIMIEDGIIKISYGIPKYCKNEKELFKLLIHSSETIQSRLTNVYKHFFSNHIRIYHKVEVVVETFEQQDNLPDDLVQYIERNRYKYIKFNYQFDNSSYSLCNPLYDNNFEFKYNEIYFDVGKCFDIGCIDSHNRDSKIVLNNKKYLSSSALLFLRPDYVFRCISPVSKELTIHLHKSPNIDCFIGVFLIRKLINLGKLDEFSNMLLEYCELSLGGNIPANISGHYSLNMLFYAIAMKGFERSFDQVVERAIQVIECCEKIVSLNSIELNDLDIKNYTGEFNEEYEKLKIDYQKYLHDKKNSFIDSNGLTQLKCQEKTVKLYKKGTDPKNSEEVKAFIWNTTPTCELHWQWAREGDTLTFVPTELNKEKQLRGYGKISVSRYYFSLCGNSKYCLNGLAVLLEEREKQKQKKLFGNRYDLYRRPSQDLNIKTDQEDKWNSPIHLDNTLVVSPHRGSLLKLDEVLSVLEEYINQIN